MLGCYFFAGSISNYQLIELAEVKTTFKKLSNKFIGGVGSVIDIMPNRKYRFRTYLPGESTAEILSKDWAAIGINMQKAISAQTDETEKQTS